MLNEVDIKHVHTNLHNSKSNGSCERGIRSPKDCLKRYKVKRSHSKCLMNLPTISIHILKITQSDLQLNAFLADLPEVVSPTLSTGLSITTNSSRAGRPNRLNWLRRREDLYQTTFALGTDLLYMII